MCAAGHGSVCVCVCVCVCVAERGGLRKGGTHRDKKERGGGGRERGISVGLCQRGGGHWQMLVAS